MKNPISRLAALCALGAISIFGSSLWEPISGHRQRFIRRRGSSVKLTLTSTAPMPTLTTTTNPEGEFQFLRLPPTTYSLSRGGERIQEDQCASVLVQVDQITHLELKLEVGTVTESVQVESAAPLLENDKSTLSSVVDSRNIGNMPLNGRQALDLALITPGVLPTATGTQVLSFNVAGARSQSNIYLWDGVSNMDTQVNVST